MAAFACFVSDLDASTQRLLNRGARLTELLKQGQYSPLPFEEQVVSIFSGVNGYLDGIPADQVVRFEQALLSDFRANQADLLSEIRTTKDLSDPTRAKRKAAIDQLVKTLAEQGRRPARAHAGKQMPSLKDRKSVVSGKRGKVREELGGPRATKKNK